MASTAQMTVIPGEARGESPWKKYTSAAPQGTYSMLAPGTPTAGLSPGAPQAAVLPQLAAAPPALPSGLPGVAGKPPGTPMGKPAGMPMPMMGAPGMPMPMMGAPGMPMPMMGAPGMPGAAPYGAPPRPGVPMQMAVPTFIPPNFPTHLMPGRAGIPGLIPGMIGGTSPLGPGPGRGAASVVPGVSVPAVAGIAPIGMGWPGTPPPMPPMPPFPGFPMPGGASMPGMAAPPPVAGAPAAAGGVPAMGVASNPGHAPAQPSLVEAVSTALQQPAFAEQLARFAGERLGEWAREWVNREELVDILARRVADQLMSRDEFRTRLKDVLADPEGREAILSISLETLKSGKFLEFLRDQLRSSEDPT